MPWHVGHSHQMQSWMLELAGVLVDQISAASRPALQRSFQLFTGLQLLGRRVADKGGPARAPGQPEETRGERASGKAVKPR